MKQHFSLYFFFWVVLLLYLPLPTLYANSHLPESELSWSNVKIMGKHQAVFSLYRDTKGVVWLGTNNGLYYFDGFSVHSVANAQLQGSQIHAMVEFDGSLYLGTNNGLVRCNFLQGESCFTHADLPKEIRALLLVDHQLWIGSLNGLYLLDLRRGSVTDLSATLPHRSVYSLLRDSRGILYAGTYNGLARWNNDKQGFHALAPSVRTVEQTNLFVNSLLESPDGRTILIGTEGALYAYTPALDQWCSISTLSNNNIKSLAKCSDGHILIGTDNGLFDWSHDSIRHFRHDSRHELSLSDNEIWCVMADDQHNIWAGHERGFSISSHSSVVRTIKLSSLTHTGEGNEIHAIYRDSQRHLWLGGTNGVLRLSPDGVTTWFRHSSGRHSLSHNRIRSIDEDSNHHLWLSTDGGLNRFNPRKGGFDVFHVVDKHGEHNSNWVYAFEERGDDYWVGSFIGGLHRVGQSKFQSEGGTIVADFSLNADSSSVEVGVPHLSNNLVNNMLADHLGNLWILLFRDHLLTRYNPETNTLLQFDILQLTGAYPTHLSRDGLGRIVCAFKGGVLFFYESGRYEVVKFPYTNSDESVLAMGAVERGLWISTESNVWRVDGDSLRATLLPIPQKSYTAIYEDKLMGRVLLGGTDEILEVDYRNLGSVTDYKSVKLVLRDVGNSYQTVQEQQGVLQRLSIPYGGGITLVVSTLDYSPHSSQRFMYHLSETTAGANDRWIILPEGANTITLSDLKMGDYQLQVKVVGSPAPPLHIPLQVQAPWMLSFWAIALYLLIAISLILGIIAYMRRRNLRLLREKERESALENVERKLSFLSSIAHDLKTPLSMILAPVSLMKERVKDPEMKHSLAMVYDNAVRLNNMIHRTLELRHIEEGDEDLLILSTFDVVEFCKEVFDVFQENHAEKKFIFHSSCSRLYIEADAVKLESVMTNLLSNACKYSDEGATISCAVSLREDQVEITVSDDGVGIADADQSLVFQRMFRASSTAKLREGTGLGLYLIKKYLERMKGNIFLYSREGEGTSFVVTLPLSEHEIPASSSSAGGEESGKAKILIVEDNLQISSFITDLLKENYTCFTAEHGRAGLSIASSVVPDLILVDEMMPIMNGMEMVKRIKQHPRLSAIPIIMLTAKSDNQTENESIKMGIDIFMSKPFEPAALLARISHLLKSESALKEKVRIQTLMAAETKPIEAESVQEKQLAKIAKVIEENIADPDLNVNLLCEKSGIPNKQLYRLIKKYMDIGPLDYIRRVRLQKAALLLSQHRFTIAEISYMVGFKTPSYFAKCFQNQYGVKPSQYQSEDENVSLK